MAAAAVVIALGVTGGTAFGIAQAQSEPSTSVGAAPTTTAPGPSSHRPGSGPFGHRDGRLATVLDGLVAKGTITRGQADAILAAMDKGDGARTHGPGRGLFRSFEGIEANVAATLGVTPEALRAELRNGKSLAEIANAHGVSTDKLVSTITADVTDVIDQAQKDGHLDAEQAAKFKAHLPDFVTELVNGKGFGFGLDGPGFGRHRGTGGPTWSGPEGDPGTTRTPPSLPDQGQVPPGTSAPASSTSVPTSPTPTSTVPSPTS